MVGLAACVAHLEHQVPGELALHCEAPFLDGGREHIGVNASRLVDGAGLRYPWAASGRERSVPIQRKQREEPTGGDC